MPEIDYWMLFIQLIGFIGSGVMILSFQFKSVKVFYIVQFIAVIFFTTHFILLKAPVGAIQNFLGLVRGIFLMNSDKKWAHNNYTLGFLLIAYVVTAVVFFDNIFSVFPTIAMIASTLVMWTKDNKKIRVAQCAVVSPCWLIYNISVGSVSGGVTESINILSSLVSLIRFCFIKKNNSDVSKNN